ncbi:MAG TPA: hypothetical protein IAD26_03205 [Candidatus Limenecus avicola]|jgi:hypothetical protein|uniref:Uncharacterized protein n=1 Tax=Candidatus Limenecus avicola TaxID=2840847 RepID=A0A9D1SQX6_9CLOT|nr:hypothetical protein [Clostridium sp.]CDC20504.1 unknown [Clostridium sp. CAG:306]HIU92125.1 hypothetical protein [Candidatus Limenecus avicola]
MPDDMNIDAYITSPYSSDLKKQRDAAFDSARNIRKVTETPEEYRIRMAQQEMAHKEQLKNENTDVLQQRLANIDIANIATKNRAAIENMIREAESIKYFALYNNYDMSAIDFRNLDKAVKAAQLRLQSLKKGEDKRDIGTGIFADTYRKSTKNDSILDKLLGG